MGSKHIAMYFKNIIRILINRYVKDNYILITNKGGFYSYIPFIIVMNILIIRDTPLNIEK